MLRDGGHEEAPTECSGTKAMPTGAWEVEVQFAENKATSSGYSREEATPVGCWKAEAKPAGTWEDYLVETTRLLSLDEVGGGGIRGDGDWCLGIRARDGEAARGWGREP